MTEENTTAALEALKEQATLLGITYHPSIGFKKLQNKVDGALQIIKNTPAPSPEEDTKASEYPVPTPLNTRIAEPIVTKLAESAAQRRMRLIADASRLVRIRVTCMNPSKREYEGEIFTVSNSVVGTFRKYVPYNIEEGWLVPNIIFKHLKERECQVFQTQKMPGGEKKRVGKLIKEMAIEVLDPLTEEEIVDLATRQAISHSID